MLFERFSKNFEQGTKDGKKMSENIFVLVIGVLSGLSLQLDFLAGMDVTESLSLYQLTLKLAMGAIFMPVIFFFMRAVAQKTVQRFGLDCIARKSYRRLNSYSFSIFLVFGLGIVGLHVTRIFVFTVVSLWLLVQVLLLIGIVEVRAHLTGPKSLKWIIFLFLFSGMAALIYQIVWQRVLFTAFGVNIESITLIVSIFMFGLGVGSLAGGKLSMKFDHHLPKLFVICELAIGSFGIISIFLINFVSITIVNAAPVIIAVTVYALLAIPTFFMGATFPILATYLHQHYGHVGKSVGDLYWINTIGSAFACFLTVNIIFPFRYGGMQTAVCIAAALNFTVAAAIILITSKSRPLESGTLN